MAKHLDLEEQEQLDQIKHFWAQYGNLITWVLIVVAASLAAWNGWQYWQREQSAKATALYDEIERAALGGDAARLEGSLAEMQQRFASTAQASQGTLLAARVLFDEGKAEPARAALAWVAGKGADDAYRAVARLRLAAMHLEAGQHDEAMKALDSKVPAEFQGLFDDRKGDVLLAQGKAGEARQRFEAAWKAMDASNPYRKLVEVKLASLGVSAAMLGEAKES